VILGSRGGEEVDDEGDHPEGVDQGDNPFDDGRVIPPPKSIENTEHYREHDFDKDKCEFHPEGHAQDAEFAEPFAQPLVFGAREACGYDITANE